MAKGKVKRGRSYTREKRNEKNVPESRTQLLKFIKDQNKELKYFINETTEIEDISARTKLSDIFDTQYLDIGEVPATGRINCPSEADLPIYDEDEEMYDSDEAMLQLEEMEF